MKSVVLKWAAVGLWVAAAAAALLREWPPKNGARRIQGKRKPPLR